MFQEFIKELAGSEFVTQVDVDLSAKCVVTRCWAAEGGRVADSGMRGAEEDPGVLGRLRCSAPPWMGLVEGGKEFRPETNVRLLGVGQAMTRGRLNRSAPVVGLNIDS